MGSLMVVFGGEQNEPRNETWAFNFGNHTFLKGILFQTAFVIFAVHAALFIRILLA